MGDFYRCIRSWTDQAEVRDAQRRLATINNAPSNTVPMREFEFVINDEHTYYKLTDFTSPQARDAFNRYRQVEKTYQEIFNRLEQLRNQYASGDSTTKNRLRSTIQQEELKEKELFEQLAKIAKEVRILENRN